MARKRSLERWNRRAKPGKVEREQDRLLERSRQQRQAKQDNQRRERDQRTE